MTTGHHVRGDLAVGRVHVAEGDRGRRHGGGGRHHAEGDAHEVGPDRQRGLRAREAQHVPLIEPDPDEGDEPGRVADEPGVAALVRRARLPGDRSGHAEGPRRGAGAAVEHTLEQVSDEEGLVRPEPRLPIGARLADAALAVDHGAEPGGAGPVAAARERRERRRQLDRGHLEAPENEGRHGVHGAREPGLPGRTHDGVVADGLGHPHRRGVQRLLERPAHGDRPLVPVLVVARRPRAGGRCRR